MAVAERETFGFRRIERVRVVLEGGHATAEVTGIVHRYPRTVRVPLRVATQLVLDGAPLTIERVEA